MTHKTDYLTIVKSDLIDGDAQLKEIEDKIEKIEKTLTELNPESETVDTSQYNGFNLPPPEIWNTLPGFRAANTRLPKPTKPKGIQANERTAMLTVSKNHPLRRGRR